MSQDRTPILFLTNSEYGQANVILAVAQELVRKDEFAVHLASFADFEPRISLINQKITEKKHDPIIFHSIPVASMVEMGERQGVTLPHHPGIPHAVASYKNLNNAILGWTPSEYMQIYQICLNLIQDLKPKAVILDPGFWMGNDACRVLGINYIVIAPNSVKDLAGQHLPKGAMIWKYPFMGSGYSYPLSWLDTFKNVYLAIRGVMTIATSSHIKGFNEVRKEAGIKHNFPMLDFYRKEDLYLFPWIPELDYPLEGIPENFISCGPLVFPPESLEKVDANLANWLQKGPTVMINLGTHFSSEEKPAVELSKALKILFTARPDVQVLWKLKFSWRESAEVSAIVTEYVDSGRLRIESWLDAEPATILSTGKIICSVNHGGANSYYEACLAGIPQVVLPVWWDTYEYASRVEWLGIGLVGNKGVAPGCEGTQLGQALLQSVEDEKLRNKAKELGQIAKKTGGRELAAQKIAEWAKAN